MQLRAQDAWKREPGRGATNGPHRCAAGADLPGSPLWQRLSGEEKELASRRRLLPRLSVPRRSFAELLAEQQE